MFISIKLVVVGDDFPANFIEDRGREKTALLYAYQNGTYPKEYIPTVFDNGLVKMEFDEDQIELGLWDTSGQEDYDRLRPLTYSGANVFFVLFSVGSRKTLENIQERWIPEIQHHTEGKVPFILVGTQVELREDQDYIDKLTTKGSSCITYDEGFQKACEIGAYGYAECSSLKHSRLKELFDDAVRLVLGKEEKEFKVLRKISEQDVSKLSQEKGRSRRNSFLSRFMSHSRRSGSAVEARENGDLSSGEKYSL